jgi:hypothetical protein
MFLVACAVESVPVSSQNEAAVSTPAEASDGTVARFSTGTPTTDDLSCFRQCLASCSSDPDCAEICRCLCFEPEYCN